MCSGQGLAMSNNINQLINILNIFFAKKSINSNILIIVARS